MTQGHALHSYTVSNSTGQDLLISHQLYQKVNTCAVQGYSVLTTEL
uniref:Uncharacterized protein n=1 Tax=Arundo donax TaxID=35708 RepID=A0A0A8ZKZ7_ARUDO